MQMADSTHLTHLPMIRSKEHDSEHTIHSHSESDSEPIAGHGDEVNPLIKMEHYKHRPLSPTPVDSLHSGESHTQSIIQPLKPSTEFMFMHPTQTFTHKQLYEYVETIVIRHVTQSNQTINHDQPLHLESIKSTLLTLKSLLVSPECDILVDHDEETSSKAPELEALKSSEDVIETQPQQTAAKKMKWCTHSTRSLWNVFVPSSALLHHPTYSINVNKYYGLLRGSVRQDWNTIETDDDEERNWEELKPHWFELFFDLMFVAAIVHISSEVADAYEHGEYLFMYTVFPQFGLLILCWLEQVLYHSRFRMTQTKDGFLRFIYMALVLMMGLSIGNTNNQTGQKLFLVSYMLTKFAMCLMFVKSSFIPRAFNHSIYMIIENVVSIVAVIFVEIFVNVPQNVYEKRQWVWTVIYAVLFVYSYFHMAVMVYMQCIRDLGVNIPINVPHIAERMGAFVLIILGETIISIMIQHVESTRMGIIRAYSVTMSFFVIVYCIGKLYFESQPTEHEIHHHKKSHAMSTSIWRARIFKWFNILLFFGLLGLGLGSKITIHELPHYHGSRPIFVFLPGISCVIICICINIIRLTHPFDYSEKHPHMVIGVWILRILCICIMFGILFLWQIANHAIILGVYVTCFIIQIFVDFEAKTRLIVTKSVDKSKSLNYYKSPKAINHFNGNHFNAKKESQEITATKELSFIGAF